MDLILINADQTDVGLFDIYDSLIWTVRYNEYGDFELYLPASPDLFNQFDLGMYLETTESDRQMIVETIELDEDEEKTQVLIITGRSLESILERRTVSSKTILTGNLQDEIHRLLKENLIDPVDPDRKIDDFIFVASDDSRITDLKIERLELHGETLGTVIQELCASEHIGFKVIRDHDGLMYFSLYKGLDRHYDQIDNNYIIFSPEFDNFISNNYIKTIEQYKNTTIVAKDTGNDSFSYTTHYNGDQQYGLNRFESLIQIGSDDDPPEQAKENFKDNKYIEALDGMVDKSSEYVYNIDYDIGDTVQLTNSYGMDEISRITEIIFVQDENGKEIYPTFIRDE